MNKVRGFTLLEVMVALSICALAGIAAMQATGQHIVHVSSIESQTYASWVAENQLALLKAGTESKAPKNGEKGDEELAGIKWYWQQVVAPTEAPDFVKVTINVYSDEAMTQMEYDLTTYIYKETTR
ncbi:type II secretion system minor pseudopilin GspI [Pseudoalteromonas xiamenensis]|uniref:type II secretion system minor pseudopilin GspI n=1 Tax=Pseudoalteromonas xiamenensis TaxID=882626 RepID=UPI0035E5F409